jgi:Protein of unknown function (DUF3223)
MPAKPITIAGIRFARQRDAIARCQMILNSGQPGEHKFSITGEHARFLEALLRSRPNKLGEIGDRTIAGFKVDWQPAYNRTKCFWVILDDGTEIDFSFKKSIRSITDAQHSG